MWAPSRLISSPPNMVPRPGIPRLPTASTKSGQPASNSWASASVSNSRFMIRRGFATGVRLPVSEMGAGSSGSPAPKLMDLIPLTMTKIAASASKEPSTLSMAVSVSSMLRFASASSGVALGLGGREAGLSRASRRGS